jgi:threonine dehydrogenase-like Zn-dependent dehydrogenase
MLAMPTARSFWILAPGHGEIVSAELPPRQAGEVLVRTRYSGISRGTEALVFRGAVPPSQRAAMRAPFQEGEFPGPVKYGYSSVGIVEEGPDRLRGRTVFCLYPHQDRYCVPAAAVHPVPECVPPSRAVLAANMETAVNVVWDARPAPGDEIVVIGGGVVGLLAATLCRDLPGAQVTVVDPNRSRAAVAAALGLAYSPDPPGSATADLVIHASGSPDGLRAALAVAGQEATIVEASWYGTSQVPLPLGEAFHAGRLTIRSSQVGQVPPDRAPRWSRGRRLELALALLADARLDALVTGESGFDELPAVLATLAAEPGDTLCHRIRYTDPQADGRSAA